MSAAAVNVPVASKHHSDSKDPKSGDKRKHDDKNQKQDDFLVDFKYNNALPPVPSGPFFSDFGMVESFQLLRNYKMSSLEKSYIWQPHPDPLVGIDIDLVDMEHMFKGNNVLLNSDGKEDLRYLDVNDSKNKKDESSKTPNELSWLRSTTHMGSGLTFQKGTIGSDKEGNKKIKMHFTENSDPLSVAYIEKSFTLVNETLAKEVSKQAKHRNTVVYSAPLLPYNNDETRDYCHVRFDELPYYSSLHSSNNLQTDSSIDTSKNIVHNSIVSNIRRSAKNANKFTVSVVSSHKNSNANSMDVDNNIDDKSVHYDWISDFDMSIDREKSSYIFVLDKTKKEAQYLPYYNRIYLKKANIEDIAPCEAFVSRREVAREETNE
jgi:hypothetical protein